MRSWTAAVAVLLALFATSLVPTAQALEPGAPLAASGPEPCLAVPLPTPTPSPEVVETPPTPSPEVLETPTGTPTPSSSPSPGPTAPVELCDDDGGAPGGGGGRGGHDGKPDDREGNRGDHRGGSDERDHHSKGSGSSPERRQEDHSGRRHLDERRSDQPEEAKMPAFPGGFSTAALLRAAQRRAERGWSPERIRRAVYAPFIIVGPSWWTNTWGAPRFGPGPIVRTHEGQDVFCRYGAPVLASQNGVIEFDEGGLGGRVARLHRADGSYFYYAHLSEWNTERFASGDRVRRGDVIGFCGNTGNAAATAPHVHFGWYRASGEPRNPMRILVRWLHVAEKRVFGRIRSKGEFSPVTFEVARSSPVRDEAGFARAPIVGLDTFMEELTPFLELTLSVFDIDAGFVGHLFDTSKQVVLLGLIARAADELVLRYY